MCYVNFHISCLLTFHWSYSHAEIADLKDVNEYVFDLDKSQFKQLGLQLGLLLPTLKRIADCTKPEDYGTKVMTEWLKQVDNAQPTWNNLARALDKRTVRGHVQANQIREDLKSTWATLKNMHIPLTHQTTHLVFNASPLYEFLMYTQLITGTK